tara:strand:- start:26 stop:769 length:744 start_codon:yes stop_codon:yes gene_type:complete
MSWLSKRLKPSKKAKKWWNKNVKPIGKEDFLTGAGSLLALADPTNVTSLATCIGAKDYWSCVDRRAGKGISGLYMKAGDKNLPTPDQIMNNPMSTFDIPTDVPTHTGVDVTTGWDPESGMTQAEYQAIVDQYTDNTTFGNEGAPLSPTTTTSGNDDLKRSKPWLYAVSEKGDSNLLSLINQMLKDPKPKKMAMGGPIGMDSMMPSRRMYGKKKKPIMQTSTAGMPMRGMNAGIPMMKQGGMTKKYHI